MTLSLCDSSVSMALGSLLAPHELAHCKMKEETHVNVMLCLNNVSDGKSVEICLYKNDFYQ